jgi:hypothetical protein
VADGEELRPWQIALLSLLRPRPRRHLGEIERLPPTKYGRRAIGVHRERERGQPEVSRLPAHLLGPGDFNWHEIPGSFRSRIAEATSPPAVPSVITKIDQELDWRLGGPRACMETQFLQID